MCCKTRVTYVWDFNLVVYIVAHIDRSVRPTGPLSVAIRVMLARSQFSFSSVLLLLRSTFPIILMGFIYVSIEGFLLCHPGVLPNSDPQNCVPCFLLSAFFALTCEFVPHCWLTESENSPPLSDTTGLPSPLRWIPESCFILPAAPFLSLVERRSP